MNFEKTIITNLKTQAEKYLFEAEEFYPYGVIINQKNELIPISYYDGQEFPEPEIILNGLKEYIINELEKNNIKMGGIGVNVTIKDKNENPKDALMTMIFKKNSIQPEIQYYEYEIKDKKVTWKD